MFDPFDDIDQSTEFVSLMEEDLFCAELWGAFSNTDWYKKFDPTKSEEDQIIEVLSAPIDERIYSASFRVIASSIANIRNKHFGYSEEYIIWYCSYDYGALTDRVKEAMKKLGWVIHIDTH